MRARDAFLAYVFRFIGLPYRWGGNDPMEGFDCSGLVVEGLQAVGLLRLKDATAQALFEETKGRQRLTAVPGCLMFYGRDLQSITHVAICAAVLSASGQALVIEAGGGDSTTTSTARASQQNAFIRMRPHDWGGRKVLTITDPFYERQE